MKHPARVMQFDELWHTLQTAKAEGLVNENVRDGLHLFCYTKCCVYDKAWDETTMLARGIILDPAAKRVVATPFPKFFNVGERLDSIPDLPFETFEKLDGSLIILFHHAGQWRCATKGSLGSDQAKWAASWIANYDLSILDTDTTYLSEGIYPENRIVVHYDRSGLFLLGAYRVDGTEPSYDEIKAVADSLGWPHARRHSFTAISELFALAKVLPPSEEGFVLRFQNGLRLKVKGDEYCRIHRLISRVTPLAMWEAMLAGDDLEMLRRQLPEEFWTDFDAITSILQGHIDAIVAEVKVAAESLSHLSDKELGLSLNNLPENVRRFIFAYRKSGDLLAGRTRETLFKAIRPTGNVLRGYAPSSTMNRVLSEAA